MTIEQAIAIQTPLGIFENYRDGIILNKIEWENVQLNFYCNISTHAIIEYVGQKEEIDFKLTFKNIVSLFHSELDTYCAIQNIFPKLIEIKSIFSIIENSNYIRELPIRKDFGNVNHYFLSTYDDIFNILAKSYSFELL